MGAHPYWYTVPYQEDVRKALHELREREFRAGRYNPVIPFLEFPLHAGSPAPGARHATIEGAQEDADADGTRSILDIADVSDTPDFSMTTPLSPEELESTFGTTVPTREMVENLDFFEDIERGQCVHFVVYKDGNPHELIFAGYSFD